MVGIINPKRKLKAERLNNLPKVTQQNQDSSSGLSEPKACALDCLAGPCLPGEHRVAFGEFLHPLYLKEVGTVLSTGNQVLDKCQ